MKKTLLTICAFTAILALSECTEKKLAKTTKTTTAADEIAEIKAKYTPAQMTQGKVLFETRCADCHELKPPADFTIAEWNKILPDMSHKAKMTSDEAGLLRSWVITNAKAG